MFRSAIHREFLCEAAWLRPLIGSILRTTDSAAGCEAAAYDSHGREPMECFGCFSAVEMTMLASTPMTPESGSVIDPMSHVPAGDSFHIFPNQQQHADPGATPFGINE